MDEQKVSTAEDIERSDPRDAEEQFQLAQRYFKGSGTKKDYEKAAEWYGKAALQGHAGAQFKMGQSYMKGLGVEEDHKRQPNGMRKPERTGILSARIRSERCISTETVWNTISIRLRSGLRGPVSMQSTRLSMILTLCSTMII